MFATRSNDVEAPPDTAQYQGDANAAEPPSLFNDAMQTLRGVDRIPSMGNAGHILQDFQAGYRPFGEQPNPGYEAGRGNRNLALARLIAPLFFSVFTFVATFLCWLCVFSDTVRTLFATDSFYTATFWAWVFFMAVNLGLSLSGTKNSFVSSLENVSLWFFLASSISKEGYANEQFVVCFFIIIGGYLTYAAMGGLLYAISTNTRQLDKGVGPGIAMILGPIAVAALMSFLFSIGFNMNFQWAMIAGFTVLLVFIILFEVAIQLCIR
eukprot:CAMPEP_0114563480 /NCGR_PEP_ID=MMETSP0114-20121206/13134_1 /TAXON_ID=31324 /ORGANISM="Goniomonas sp, Strain m" /LENGTH=266 /DNA_ID=CAMNT_0001749333 /DNA_START=29 /DNA_END=829 /DNA_ORIENTATION=-